MSQLKDHWDQYLVGLGKQSKPESTNAFQTTSTQIGVSGFLDVKPVASQQQFQARYDAMSGSWEGVHASEKAVLSSRADQTQFMPFSR